jgi:anti-sigma factor RsiW
MKHRELQLLASSYVDDQLTGKEKKAVLAHLEECSECRLFVEEAKRIRTEIRSLGRVELPYAFASRVAHAVERREERTAEWLGIEPLARNTFIVIAAIVLLVFAFTKSESPAVNVPADQMLDGLASDSIATHVLLKQSELTRNDLLYAVLTQ